MDSYTIYPIGYTIGHADPNVAGTAYNYRGITYANEHAAANSYDAGYRDGYAAALRDLAARDRNERARHAAGIRQNLLSESQRFRRRKR